MTSLDEIMGLSAPTEPVSSIQNKILSIRREQHENDGKLIQIPQDIYVQTALRIKELRSEALEYSDDPDGYELIKLEYESIASAVEELKQTRSELIWSLAWTGDGHESTMIPDEYQDYLEAREVAKKIRGE